MKTTKMLAGLVGVAGMLVSGAAGAQSTPDQFGSLHKETCGCVNAVDWNVPAGAAVTGRSAGFFKGVMDVMGEYWTHIMLYRGYVDKDPTQTPWVLHASAYEGTIPSISGDTDIPLTGKALAFNGPGASRFSVGGSYLYYYGLQGSPKQPEALQYHTPTTILAAVCEGDYGFQDVRCIGGVDGPCWLEENPDENWKCEPGGDINWEEWERLKENVEASPAAQRPAARIRPDMERHIWGVPNKHIEAFDGEDSGLPDEPLPVMCRGENVKTRKLCYSVKVNLGQQAAGVTDMYRTTEKIYHPMKSREIRAGLSEGAFDQMVALGNNTLADEWALRNRAEDVYSSNPFILARHPDGQWGSIPASTEGYAGYQTPYFLRQYVSLDGVNEGYGTRGLACSTFLSFIQAQTALWQGWRAKLEGVYKWDAKFGAIQPKHYPDALVRKAAFGVYSSISNKIHDTVLEDDKFTYAVGLGLGILGDAMDYGGNQVANCILFGPDQRGECSNTSPHWRVALENPQYLEMLNAASISSDWLVGRSSSVLDENGIPIGGINPRESIWANGTAANVEYSSEGKICTCW